MTTNQPSSTTQGPGRRPREITRRAALLSGAAVAVGLSAAAAKPAAALQRATGPQQATGLRSAATRLTLPAPTGHYRLGTVSLDLIDTSRPDPWVPAIPFRELIVQFWYPAAEVEGFPRAPYFTPITARAYEQAQSLPVINWPVTHAHVGAPVHPRAGGWPVVLFSPGQGGERSDTTSLVEDLASRGYVVVTIDHIHDCNVVELPDGRVETSAITFTPETELQVTIKGVESRAADVRFILDQLAVITAGGNPDHEHRPLPRGLRGGLDLRRVGMFGHSDGGSTTGHVMHDDPRIIAGVDLDGTFWTQQGTDGSDRPLLLFGEQDLAPLEASSWAEFLKNQRGPKLQLSLLGSKHLTFTDFAPLLPQVALIIGQSQTWVDQGIGTIGPHAVAVERAYISAWFDTFLRHRGSHLLAGPSPRYPEVVFVSR
jgi:predicted dienelactone hydrolase